MNVIRRWLVVGGGAALVVAAGGVAQAHEWEELPPLDGELCADRAEAAEKRQVST